MTELLRNTVILDLNQYNELKEFKEEISKSKIYVKAVPQVNGYVGYNFNTVYVHDKEYITESEAIKEISDRYDIVVKQHEELERIIFELRNPPKTSKEPTVIDLKNMSLWKLLKWKFKK